MINWKILWFSLSTGLQFSILSVSQPVGNQHSGHIWHGNMKCAKYIIMDLATTEQDLIFSNKQWHHTQKQEMTSMVFYYKPEDTSAFLHIYLHFLYYTQWMHALRKYINFVILEPNVIHTYTCYRNEGGGFTIKLLKNCSFQYFTWSSKNNSNSILTFLSHSRVSNYLGGSRGWNKLCDLFWYTVKNNYVNFYCTH